MARADRDGARPGLATDDARHGGRHLSEERYRTLVAASSAVVWTTSAEGEFVEPQASWEADTGQPWPAHAGWGWAEMLHPDDREAVTSRWVQALAGGEEYESEGRLWHAASAGYRHVRARAVALRGPDGAVREWVGTVSDLHEHHLTAGRFHASELELRTVLENLPVGVWLTDAEGAIVVDNPAGQRIWGVRHTGRDHVGVARGWRVETGEPIAPDEWSLARALRQGEAVIGELIEIETNAGERKTLLSSAVPVKSEAGAIEGAVVINEDVTERMRAEAALQVLAEAGSALGASLDHEQTLAGLARLAVPRLADWCAIDLADEDGRIARLVVAAADPAKERLVRALSERYPSNPEARAGVPAVIRTGRPELVQDVSDGLLVADARDDEHLRGLRELGMASVLRVPLVAHGRTFGALSLVAAESGRRYGPEHLTLAQELARRAAVAVENARLYRAAQEAARTAEAAVAVRDQFLAIATHELRTPLTPLKASVQLLRRQLARGGAPADLDRLAERAEQQVDRLSRLIEPLLDVSRLGTGRLAIERQPLALIPLLERVVDLARSTVEPPRPYLLSRPDSQPVVMGDEARLEQVLVNLLENARKYSPAGSPIEVSVRGDAATVAIAVRDHGIGIPEAEHAQIFDRFHRASNVGRDTSGFGLGLHIAREIAQMHDGTLTVASTPGEGSTFTLTLPVAT
jgi:PAS domain S-box-containing protein